MSGDRCNPVQEKISCVYVTGVTNELSTKRPQQNFKVSATRDVTSAALVDDIPSARVTEKFDGTCCLVDIFNGNPWLWARHDRKPSKAADRRFAQYKKSLAKPGEDGERTQEPFSWTPKDFKEVPDNWIPASRLEVRDGFVVPDSIGHTPGWVPVELKSRQHCWHLSAVDLIQGVAIVLRNNTEEADDLVVETQHLSSLCGQTCELIGTNINGNPYGLGSKKCPVHMLVPHGSLSLECPHVADYDVMCDWFSSDIASAQVEGIVWHCQNGKLHKLHRHHLNLKWPVEAPYLTRRKVKVELDLSLCDASISDIQKGQSNIFFLLSSINGHEFDDIYKMCDALCSQTQSNENS